MNPNDDLVTRALSELPSIEVDDLLADRVHKAASAALAQGPRRRRLRRVEPVLAYAVAAAYLIWAFQVIIG